MSTAGNSQSLKESLKRVWITLGLIAFAVSALAFSVVGYTDYRKNIDRIEDDLTVKSKVIERRVSAELLVSRMSVAENVLQDLKHYYELSNVSLGKGKASCGNEVCIHTTNGAFVVSRPLSEPTAEFDSLEVSAPVPSFLGSLRFIYFVVVFLPIFSLFFIGIWIQRRILNRSLVQPIEALVGTAYRGEVVPDYWPSEFVELSQRLDDAFRERDQAMIGQMASGVLHDMKTLLHGLSVSTELAEESKGISADQYFKKLESLLKVSSVQVPKMKSIIESVLDGNRIIEPALESHSIRSTVAGAVAVNYDYADKKGVTIESEIDDFVALHDSAQLERAVFNLVKNSIEAIDQKSLLKKVLLTATKDDKVIRISIEDSGTGLKVDPIRIFKGIKTTKTHGTGLGLLVTRKIVEAHGGSVVAGKSDLLGGAKFTVTIPNLEGKA